MDIKQITNSLNDIFNKEKHRIVFWYDAEKEFTEILQDLDLPDVTILRKDAIGTLELKIRLELEDTKGRYIVYIPFSEPSAETDWLLDIKLYSRTFNADHASMILNELNLSNHSLRTYINRRKKFFANQDRLNRLKKWTTPEDMEGDLDLKMITVVTKAEQPNLFSILLNIFAAYCNDDSFNPDKTPKIWEEIDKFGLSDPFWDMIEMAFGYANYNATLFDLIIRLFITDFDKSLGKVIPQGIEHFVIKESSGTQNASVFLSQWRNHIVHFRHYNIIANHINNELKIADKLQNLNVEQLLEITTFESVERKIISTIRDMLLEGKGDTYDQLKEYIQTRNNTHWPSTKFKDNKNINLYKITYDALETVIDLFQLRNKYTKGLSYSAADSMFNAYTQELFLFDQYYRRFQQAADIVELEGWDILKTLKPGVEDCYSGWFLEQMAITWDGLIEQGKSGGLLQNWRLPDINNQYKFYNEYVHNYLISSPRGRVFVIISDAFRYEAAEELTHHLNGKYRFKATIEPILGVAPSYTALGMAALLPHKSIDYKDGSKDIFVNGKFTGSLIKRSEILAENNGIAIKADDLTSMKKDDGREFVKPHKIIYIYHNLIDSAGDKESTESNVFNAANKSIDQLGSLISFIINSLNGSYVVVTADHGFIYYERAPKPINKSVLGNKPSKAIEAKKRFIIGEKLGKSKKVLSGNTKDTAKTEQGMEFWLPRGINRFHFVGGARYFHGGAMLQEVVVPVIKIKEARGKELEKTRTKEVGVSLLGSSRKIVTNIHRFEFIQTDPVTERVKPRALVISLRDGNNLISNEETVSFDSNSSSMDDRKKSVKLMLKAYQYDNKKEYSLVLRDAGSDIEYERIPINIDLAFINDF